MSLPLSSCNAAVSAVVFVFPKDYPQLPASFKSVIWIKESVSYSELNDFLVVPALLLLLFTLWLLFHLLLFRMWIDCKDELILLTQTILESLIYHDAFSCPFYL